MSFGQGGPEWGPGGTSTPDWTALAEEAEETRSRRKRWILLGGGGVAAVLVAVVVALAVTGGGSDSPGKSQPSANELPSGGEQPEPTFKDNPPPPPPPRDFIADAERDKAPLGVKSLFGGRQAEVDGRTYKKATARAESKCADAAHAGLGPVLTKNDCRGLYRATYTRGGLAVTVGIAAFDDSTTAARVKAAYKPNLVALSGGGVPEFCRTVECRTTVNSLGRYAFFTISGRINGDASDETDKAAEQAGFDGSQYAYSRIMQRGEQQAQQAAKNAATG